MANKVLWTWDPLAHINPVTATNPQWYSYDPSSAESLRRLPRERAVGYSGGVLLMSFRHLDAIYAINTPTGSLTMKIGGSTESESYSVQNDPVFTAAARSVASTTLGSWGPT